MKKYLSLLMVFTLLLCTSACGKSAVPKTDPDTQNTQETETNPSVSDTTESATDSQESATDSQESDAGSGESSTGSGESDAGSGESSAAENNSSSVDNAQNVYPLTLTDQLGRQVTIEKEPQTLVSGYYISTSLLLALGCGDRLTGVEAKAKSRAIYHLSAPALLDLPSVGTAKEFDLEGCAALHPDLVVVPVKLKDSVPALEALGLTVLAVNPEDQELLTEATLLLGEATNTLPAANSLIQFQKEQLALLEDVLSEVNAPSVYLASNSSLLSVAGPEMYQNTLITNAGGTNVAKELTDDYWSEISYEQLLAWDPEYIILAADANYTVDSVMSDPNLSECQAVKEGHVWQLPNAIEAWDSPVPGSVLGSLWLACALHPDQYSEEEWKHTVTTFYETFYGFTPDLTNRYAQD